MGLNIFATMKQHVAANRHCLAVAEHAKAGGDLRGFVGFVQRTDAIHDGFDANAAAGHVVEDEFAWGGGG